MDQAPRRGAWARAAAATGRSAAHGAKALEGGWFEGRGLRKKGAGAGAQHYGNTGCGKMAATPGRGGATAKRLQTAGIAPPVRQTNGGRRTPGRLDLWGRL